MSARHQIDLQISLFRGVAEDIDMPVLAKDPVGLIMPGDEILGCLEWDTESTIATLADVTANVSISRAGYITNDTAPTSDIWQGMLFWYRNQGNGAHILSQPCLKQMLVTGGNASADLTATGLAVADHVIAVFHVSTAAEVSTIDDITHLCTHAEADKLVCSIATNNDHLWVWYHDVSGTGIPNPNYQFLVADGHATAITATGITTSDTIVTGIHITTKAAIASLSNTITYTAGTDTIAPSATTADDQHIFIWHDAA